MEVYHSHHQAMANHSQLDDILGGCTKVQQQQQQEQEKKPRPQPDQALHCPRCDSTNTKFCYYNNYSLSQPRYFCKGCRRYWTQGGTLRNVPVGGGCRKNKRPPSTTPAISSAKKLAGDQDHNNHLQYPSLVPPPPPLQSSDPHDLTLAFAARYKQSVTDHPSFFLSNPNPNPNPNAGFLDALRNGFVDTTHPGGLHDLCFGWWGNGMVEEREQLLLQPFESASAAALTTSSHGSCTTMDRAGECKAMQPGGGDAGLGLEPAAREQQYYWNGIGGGPFHGLVNSSML